MATILAQTSLDLFLIVTKIHTKQDILQLRTCQCSLVDKQCNGDNLQYLVSYWPTYTDIPATYISISRYRYRYICYKLILAQHGVITAKRIWPQHWKTPESPSVQHWLDDSSDTLKESGSLWRTNTRILGEFGSPWLLFFEEVRINLNNSLFIRQLWECQSGVAAVFPEFM